MTGSEQREHFDRRSRSLAWSNFRMFSPTEGDRQRERKRSCHSRCCCLLMWKRFDFDLWDTHETTTSLTACVYRFTYKRDNIVRPQAKNFHATNARIRLWLFLSSSSSRRLVREKNEKNLLRAPFTGDWICCRVRERARLRTHSDYYAEDQSRSFCRDAPNMSKKCSTAAPERACQRFVEFLSLIVWATATNHTTLTRHGVHSLPEKTKIRC